MPITLIPIMEKPLSKLLADRIKEHLAKGVHITENGFVTLETINW